VNKNLTPWFPPDSKPVRPGIYIATVVREETFYRLWDGEAWMCGGDSVREAAREGREGTATYRQNLHWRGLAEQPK
jgi:hypothetical protein